MKITTTLGLLLVVMTGCEGGRTMLSPIDPQLYDERVSCSDYVTMTPEWRVVYRSTSPFLLSQRHSDLEGECLEYREFRRK